MSNLFIDFREAVTGDITFIGTSVSIPRLIQAAVLIIALVVIGWTAFRLNSIYQELQPVKMLGNINIAVTQFRVIGDDKYDFSKDEKEILELTYTEILEDTILALDVGPIESDTDNGSRRIIINDNIEIRPPSQSKRITIQDHEDAARYAESINAQVVVYGTIDLQGKNVAYIHPHIYVASDAILDDGAEIAGSYRLGNTISILNLRAPDVSKENRETLENRLQTLIDVSIGLAYYTNGDFREAKDVFKEALNATSWEHPDVIFLLLGNSALKISQLDAICYSRQLDDPTNSHEDCDKQLEGTINYFEDYYKQLDDASNYYEDANSAYQMTTGENRKRYPRALIGLGSVAYQLARGGLENKNIEDIEPTGFESVLQLYEEALRNNNIEELPVANVAAKAHFGLGQTYLQKAVVEQFQGMEALSLEDYSRAEEEFKYIIDKYEATAPNRRTQLAELSALAHSHMGLVEFQRENFAASAEHYAQSLTIMQESKWSCTSPIIEFRTDAEEKLLYLYVEKLNNPDSARARLSNASQDLKIHCNDTNLKEWYDKQLKSLQSNEQIGEINETKNLS